MLKYLVNCRLRAIILLLIMNHEIAIVIVVHSSKHVNIIGCPNNKPKKRD